MKSTDDGRTWCVRRWRSRRRAKKPDWTWYATGPGVGIQLRGGRLVIPANHAVAGTQVHRVARAVQRRPRRHVDASGAVSVEGTNESQVVELADGRVMLNMPEPSAEAAQPPARLHEHRRRADAVGRRSTTTLPEPPAQASLLRYSTAASGGSEPPAVLEPVGTRPRAHDRAAQRRRGRDVARVARAARGTGGLLVPRRAARRRRLACCTSAASAARTSGSRSRALDLAWLER